MNTELYRNLASELCECMGLHEDASFLDSGMLIVDDLDVLLFYDEKFDPNRLQIRVDFGKLPSIESGSTLLLVELMASNFIYGLGGLAVFSMNPTNGHIVFTTQHIVERSTSAQELWFELRNSISQAHSAWEKALSNLPRTLQDLRNAGGQPVA
ncbi:hypothetical protein [Variovorax saccharolyticus]|uniref:hypothetical protein n=1 Tax=Variovorax saccharolyticus TaxID=3053516 RepID=UPI0025760CC4|nr:hypothetical protein [Variovorax sp. J31P216]MDM0030407.1 hypothetical protein [Variovorax sp. J31P216]